MSGRTTRLQVASGIIGNVLRNTMLELVEVVNIVDGVDSGSVLALDSQRIEFQVT